MHHSEKRDFIRVTVETNAELTVAGTVYAMTCVDLSTTGARLIAATPTSLGIDQKGTLVIESGGGPTAPLQAEVTIIRMAETEKGEEVAVHFDTLT